MSVYALETRGLTKYYGRHIGINGLDIQVRPGEIFGFLGPNGAGKTTTLRLLVGLLRPTSGSAEILGLDMVRQSLDIRRRVGYIPGEVRLFEHLTGEETLNLLASFRGKQASGMLKELLDRFELDPSRKVSEYSSGNRQKLAIIQAFMHDPEMLILDEPTSALDPLIRHSFYALCREFKQRGRTIFVSSHILPEMEQVCDRVAIIRKGKLVAVEDVAELARKKLRHAEFTLAEEPRGGIPRFASATVQRVNGLRFRADIRGEMDAFVKELSRLPIEDLQVNHASLEEIFLEFYRDEADDSP
ncbi:MAG: ABC transporter ATP-binding protein [Actinobacteria bacterium]|nr:ABC transporter ATP-binding protein [Actinomycetota bacterium]